MPRLPWVDVVIFNNELDTLRYRMAMHSALFSAVMIIEANLTHSGTPKPLVAKQSLLQEELTKYGAEVLEVPFTRAEARSRKHFTREDAQRRFVLKQLSARYANHFVHMSDVDEYLDPSWARDNLERLPASGCVTPRLRCYTYAIHCPNYGESPWLMGRVIRNPSSAFTHAVQHGLSLRGPPTGRCPASPEWAGWHIGYAYNSSMIWSKLRSFQHRDDVAIQKVLKLQEAELLRTIDDRASRCKDPLDRRQKKDPTKAKINSSYSSLIPFDGRAPPLAGWPEHPMAGTALSGRGETPKN